MCAAGCTGTESAAASSGARQAQQPTQPIQSPPTHPSQPGRWPRTCCRPASPAAWPPAGRSASRCREQGRVCVIGVGQHWQRATAEHCRRARLKLHTTHSTGPALCTASVAALQPATMRGRRAKSSPAGLAPEAAQQLLLGLGHPGAAAVLHSALRSRGSQHVQQRSDAWTTDSVG